MTKSTTGIENQTLPALARSDFADDFLWGCSTSSYQIEGAAEEGGRSPSIWDSFCATPGKIRDASSGAVACDHYHRWPEDLDLARQLGTNAYRFSIAWPRIFPDASGVPNQQGLDFYSALVDGMLERGLQPWATLYHWDLPQYLQDGGGWKARTTVDAFLRFADVVTARLGDRVKHWITHNEPWCTAMHGNWDGVHAPGLRDWKTALQVCHHVLLSHGKAVPLIKANAVGAQVGITLSLHPVVAASDGAADVAAARRHDGLRNRWFLDPLYGRGYPDDVWQLCGAAAPVVEEGDLAAIATATDFLGVNYYFPEVIADVTDAAGVSAGADAAGVSAGADAGGAGHAAAGALGGGVRARVVELPGRERTAFGWEVCPAGLTTLLERVAADYAPAVIYVTENGSTYEDVLTPDGDIDDVERRNYLIRHLAAMRDAIGKGINVKGYFAWSLLDNFEWAEGYLRRFGLTYVDFATQKRTLKLSGKWYRDFLRGERK